MSVIEKILKSIPYVRRPFYQRDVALAQLADAKSALAAAQTAANGLASKSLRRHFHQQLWFLLPDDDARQDQSIGDFRSYVAKMVRKDCASLEIGPSFNPILPKAAGYRVTIIDHADQAKLKTKYTTHGVDISKIEPVDIVWDGNSMAQATGRKRFDAIVAAHVIEHAPDFVQFLNDCSDALSDDGSIYLLVPDKRYAFDFLQPLSDVAKILADHRAKRARHPFESFYRLSAAVQNEGLNAWDQRGFSKLKFAHGDPSYIRPLAEQYAMSADYVDTHENFFTPVSFAMIVDELRYLGEIELELKILTRARGPEFLAVLGKAETPKDANAESYLERKMQGYALMMAEELERIRSAARFLAD